MAKGDGTSPLQSGGTAPLQPKIDQYSVMHKLMDVLGGGDNSIGPSGNKMMPMPMARSGDMNQPQNNMDGYNQSAPYIGGGSPMGGGQPFGMNNSPVAPTNPQELIRKQMTSSRTFGG